MPQTRSGHATVSLGAARAIAQRFVDEGRFESISEACRAGLHRLEQDAQIIERLTELGKEGMESGIATDFDIDRFIDET